MNFRDTTLALSLSQVSPKIKPFAPKEENPLLFRWVFPTFRHSLQKENRSPLHARRSGSAHTAGCRRDPGRGRQHSVIRKKTRPFSGWGRPDHRSDLPRISPSVLQTRQGDQRSPSVSAMGRQDRRVRYLQHPPFSDRIRAGLFHSGCSHAAVPFSTSTRRKTRQRPKRCVGRRADLRCRRKEILK